MKPLTSRPTDHRAPSPTLSVRRLPPFRSSRSGATLIVTLGILTVLSVMVVTFLLTSRLQRQTAASQQNRLTARNYMDAGLLFAMRHIEDAFTYPNYTDEEIDQGDFLTRQRLAPVSQWFSERYRETYQLSDKISFQALDVLASPVVSNALTVNLVTPQVLRLIPSALTNGLTLSPNAPYPFRSGWIPLDMLPDTTPVAMRLHSKPARIAFTVFNCSGFVDANTFFSGPTTQKLQRVCFSQSDVTNWVNAAETVEQLDNMGLSHDPLNTPFHHLSYDPGPDTYPLHYDCFETDNNLGLGTFKGTPKFDLHSVTNMIAHTDAASGDWTLSGLFRFGWLIPVTEHVLRMSHEEAPENPNKIDLQQSLRIPWNIANFIDPDRIPQVSPFIKELDLATRENCAVEDVPLINRIKVFNIFEEEQRPDPRCKPEYYDVASNLSNHYAVAVELWYPFAPNRPPELAALYAGLYTNESAAVTTTNRPWTEREIRDWFDWNNSSNPVMQTLFLSWAGTYTNTVGPTIWNHPLWQTITEQGDLWFTPSMTNHPSWPAADTNGNFSITDSPIWQAFYPETYGVVVTNQADAVTTNGTVVSTNVVDVVTTNLFTYLNTTNSYVEWISEPDLQTNRLTGRIGALEPDPYPVLLWSNLTTSAFTTNILGAFFDTDGNTNTFIAEGQTNHLITLTALPENIELVVSNDVSGAVSTNFASAFVLAPWDTNGLAFTLITNLYVTTEVHPVEPLPMPGTLGTSLAALFAMLPTNSLSSLYDFMLLTPDQFSEEDWNQLFDYFNQSPNIVNTVMPANRAPSLGSMTAEDRYALTTETGDFLDSESVVRIAKESDQFGLYWVVYPKKTVSFPEVSATTPMAETGNEDAPALVTTNYCALGSKEAYKVWLRPVVTINKPVDGIPSDAIVDEALLVKKGDSVQGWHSITNLSIADPRNNAYATAWNSFALEDWETYVATTNLSTRVSEYPFMVFDTGFTTIGDIGHIYASRAYASGNSPSAVNSTPEGESRITAVAPRHDTISFTARSDAALLDIFTIHPTNAPMRGLVQANTLQRPVLQTLMSDIRIGWTNSIDTVPELHLLRNIDNDLEDWSDIYTDALVNTPHNMGWRSFADMLPNLSTNELLRTKNVWGSSALHPMHDYTEDVMRGLVHKVSFRQNIFVIIVAAQALSPASTEKRPVVLSDQRAAVTVIRDAYTGRWTIHDWLWLTE